MVARPGVGQPRRLRFLRADVAGLGAAGAGPAAGGGAGGAGAPPPRAPAPAPGAGAAPALGAGLLALLADLLLAGPRPRLARLPRGRRAGRPTAEQQNADHRQP